MTIVTQTVTGKTGPRYCVGLVLCCSVLLQLVQAVR